MVTERFSNYDLTHHEGMLKPYENYLDGAPVL